MNLSKSIKYLVIVILLVNLSSCNETEISPQDTVKSTLVNTTWKIKTVSMDDVDYTSDYVGMTLVFTDKEFRATNGGKVWPQKGTWNFVDPDGQKIIRDDGAEIMISVTPTLLELSLLWSKESFGPGRTSSTKGKIKFALVK
jgi:hypothetical protein